MFELNKRYTHKAPKGTISETGIQLIKTYITSQNLTDEHWQAKNPDSTRRYLTPLPEDWIWQWVVTGRGEYVGTFPKRVSKYYYQTLNIKSPNEFLQGLGNIARQHSEDNAIYHFDFVDRFDWRAGDFGDRGSCYWGGNSEARDVMHYEGALAIRFYVNDKSYGRAWLAQLRDNRFIIFNGYGYTTLQIARVFAEFIGLSYKKIGLENHGNDSGLVWINSGIGYLIGDADKIANISEYDLEWGDGIRCYDCGDTANGDYTNPDGDIYCADCFYEQCDYCHDCGDVAWRDNMYYIESLEHDVCNYCYGRNYGYCNGCEQDYRNSDLTTVPAINNIPLNHFCRDCLPALTTYCITCHKTMRDCSCKR